MNQNSEKQPRQIKMEEVGKKMADTINEIILGGIPIPFVLATMDLIHHDLCNQHIAMTNQMAQIAKGSVPTPEVRNPDKPSDN
jgi:hypothetical protein